MIERERDRGARRAGRENREIESSEISERWSELYVVVEG